MTSPSAWANVLRIVKNGHRSIVASARSLPRLLYWQFRTLYGKFRKPADRRKIHKGEKNIERCKDVAHLDLFSRKGIKMRRIFPSFREKE